MQGGTCGPDLPEAIHGPVTDRPAVLDDCNYIKKRTFTRAHLTSPGYILNFVLEVTCHLLLQRMLKKKQLIQENVER